MAAAEVVAAETVWTWKKKDFLHECDVIFFFFTALLSSRRENLTESFCSWQLKNRQRVSLKLFCRFQSPECCCFCIALLKIIHWGRKNYRCQLAKWKLSQGHFEFLTFRERRLYRELCLANRPLSYFKGKILGNKKVSKASLTTEHSGKILQPALKQLSPQSSSL